MPDSLSPASGLKESKDLHGKPKVEKIRNRLLASLPASDLSLLGRHLREIPIEQGQLLEERGEPVDRVHFPQTGMISLIVAIAEDSALEVGTVGHEGAIGMAAGLGSRISSIRALVQVSGTALCIPVSRFRAVQWRNAPPAWLRSRAPTLAPALQPFDRRTRADLETVCCLAPRRAPLHGFDHAYTQEFFGQMLGIQRTTVSEAISKLQAAGLVDTQYGQIRIIDRTGLKGEACECYEIVQKHVDRLLDKK